MVHFKRLWQQVLAVKLCSSGAAGSTAARSVRNWLVADCLLLLDHLEIQVHHCTQLFPLDIVRPGGPEILMDTCQPTVWLRKDAQGIMPLFLVLMNVVDTTSVRIQINKDRAELANKWIAKLPLQGFIHKRAMMVQDVRFSEDYLDGLTRMLNKHRPASYAG